MKYPNMHLKITEVSTHQPNRIWPVAQTFPEFRQDTIFSIYAYRWIPELSLIYLLAKAPGDTAPNTHTLN